VPQKYQIRFAVIQSPPTDTFLLLVIDEIPLTKDASLISLVESQAKKNMTQLSDLGAVFALTDGCGGWRYDGSRPDLTQVAVKMPLSGMKFDYVNVEI